MQHAAGFKGLLDETAGKLGQDGADFLKPQMHLLRRQFRNQRASAASTLLASTDRDSSASLVMVDVGTSTGNPSRPEFQRCLDFVASFLAFFAAFRSFGVIAGFFLPSFFMLRSFDMLFALHLYCLRPVVQLSAEWPVF